MNADDEKCAINKPPSYSPEIAGRDVDEPFLLALAVKENPNEAEINASNTRTGPETGLTRQESHLRTGDQTNSSLYPVQSTDRLSPENKPQTPTLARRHRGRGNLITLRPATADLRRESFFFASGATAICDFTIRVERFRGRSFEIVADSRKQSRRKK